MADKLAARQGIIDSARKFVGSHYLWGSAGATPGFTDGSLHLPGSVTIASPSLDHNSPCVCAAQCDASGQNYVCAERFRHTQVSGKIVTDVKELSDFLTDCQIVGRDVMYVPRGAADTWQSLFRRRLTPRKIQGADVQDVGGTVITGRIVWGEDCTHVRHFDCLGFISYLREESMDGSATDRQLIEITSGPPPTTIANVLTLMQSIDALLPNGDGLKWFNLLYMKVTLQVDSSPPPGGWEDSAWLTRLDVVFAQFYFTAILNWLNNPANVPSSWKALFAARFHPGIERIQFALAGMNAHINHDLALALLQTDTELNLTPGKTSPEHDDFEHVNGILEAVLPQALEFLATGILGDLAQDTGKIGRLLAIWNVRAARDLAWDFADHLRSLAGITRDSALTAQDQVTGALGRSLLLAV